MREGIYWFQGLYLVLHLPGGLCVCLGIKSLWQESVSMSWLHIACLCLSFYSCEQFSGLNCDLPTPHKDVLKSRFLEHGM